MALLFLQSKAGNRSSSTSMLPISGAAKISPALMTLSSYNNRSIINGNNHKRQKGQDSQVSSNWRAKF